MQAERRNASDWWLDIRYRNVVVTCHKLSVSLLLIKIVRLVDFILRNEACLFLQIPNSCLIFSFTFMDKQSVIIKVAVSRRKVTSRVISFIIVTRVGARQPTKRGSFSGKNKIFFYSPKCPERLWGPNSRYSVG